MKNEVRAMKNVTITLADDVAAWARIEAAKEGKSLSRYIAGLLTKRRACEAQRQDAISHQREALERFLAGPDLALSENGRLPTKEELYAEREGETASSVNVKERKQ